MIDHVNRGAKVNQAVTDPEALLKERLADDEAVMIATVIMADHTARTLGETKQPKSPRILRDAHLLVYALCNLLDDLLEPDDSLIEGSRVLADNLDSRIMVKGE